MNHPKIQIPVTVDTNPHMVNPYSSERKGSKQSQNQILFTATKDQLTCMTCYLYLWRHVISLKHLSSEGLIMAIEEFLRDLDKLGFEIRYPNGKLFPIPYIFDVFPMDDEDKENDPGRRWLSNFKRANATGTGPRMYCTKPISLPRLQLLALYCHATVASFQRGPNSPRCSLTHDPLGW